MTGPVGADDVGAAGAFAHDATRTRKTMVFATLRTPTLTTKDTEDTVTFFQHPVPKFDSYFSTSAAPRVGNWPNCLWQSPCSFYAHGRLRSPYRAHHRLRHRSSPRAGSRAPRKCVSNGAL